MSELPSASDREDRLPIGEDVGRAYVDGRNEGRRTGERHGEQVERARLRPLLVRAYNSIVFPGGDRDEIVKDLRRELGLEGKG